MDLLPARIRSKIRVDEHGCWLWTGKPNHDGYGRTAWDGKTQRAHRVVWMILRGPVPAGTELDHLCKVRLCVNPDHLEPVTHAENVARGELSQVLREKFSAPRNCPQGHPMVGANLLVQTTKSGRPNRKCRICAKAAIARFHERRKARAAQTA